MLQFTPWRSAWCSENNSLRPSNCWRIARKICRKSQRRGSWSKETMHWVCDRESFKWLVQVFLTGLHLFERHVLFSTRILSHKMLSFKKVTTLANWECCILFRLRCACFFLPCSLASGTGAEASDHRVFCKKWFRRGPKGRSATSPTSVSKKVWEKKLDKNRLFL